MNLRTTLVLVLCSVGPAVSQGGTVERVSLSSKGAEAKGQSDKPSISEDGRFVAFQSTASNLVANDTNGVTDVFVHDRRLGTTTRVSIDSKGRQGNGKSQGPSISADGRFVAFGSLADNLVPNDNNRGLDIFVHDRLTGQTTRASVAWNGGDSNHIGSMDAHISADGRFVAFTSFSTNLVRYDSNRVRDVFLRDRQTKTTVLVSVSSTGRQGNALSFFPTISPDGGYVAYRSGASNLVPNDNNGVPDVFLYERSTGRTTRVSIANDGSEGNGFTTGRPSVGLGGRFVAFTSLATNLVGNDTNGLEDVFVRDRISRRTFRASVRSDGKQANGFSNNAFMGVRWVLFATNATNLSPSRPGPGFFAHDLLTRKTFRLDANSAGLKVRYGIYEGKVTPDGRHLAFTSWSDDLVANDRNRANDVFARTLLPEIRPLGPPKLGATLRFRLSDPRAPSRPYLAMTALGWVPGIRVDRRTLYLNPDPLLFLSVALPAIFQGYHGSLDAGGQAVAAFVIPNDAALRDLRLWTAFVTLDPTAPSGILGISNTAGLVLGR